MNVNTDSGKWAKAFTLKRREWLFMMGRISNQGRGAEAEPLYQRALAIAEKALGPQHPHVVNIQAYYADLLREMGRKAGTQRLH